MNFYVQKRGSRSATCDKDRNRCSVGGKVVRRIEKGADGKPVRYIVEKRESRPEMQYSMYGWDVKEIWRRYRDATGEHEEEIYKRWKDSDVIAVLRPDDEALLLKYILEVPEKGGLPGTGERVFYTGLSNCIDEELLCEARCRRRCFDERYPVCVAGCPDGDTGCENLCRIEAEGECGGRCASTNAGSPCYGTGSRCEYKVEVSADGTITISMHPDYIEYSDLMYLDLYVGGDYENVLWRFKVGEVRVVDVADKDREEITRDGLEESLRDMSFVIVSAPADKAYDKIKVRLRIETREGKLIETPDKGKNCSEGGCKYPMAYEDAVLERLSIRGSGVNLYKTPTSTPIMVTALSWEDIRNLRQKGTYLYSGVGKVYLAIWDKEDIDENTGEPKAGRKALKRVPIEPLGIIVIGIDGLRQDVLYDSSEASYSDPEGCGGQSCNIPISRLRGLSQILTQEGTIKLRDVTAIFPSITLASWASIFTGKLPNETGITGNEFFARDLTMSVPFRYNKPSGIVSFGNGAFKGYDDIFPSSSDFFIPYQFNWKEPVDALYLIDGDIRKPRSPQNDCRILKTDTLFEKITGTRCGTGETGISEVMRYYNERGGDSVVIANQHYARGGYWLTWDIPWMDMLGGTSKIMDSSGWDKLDDYLSGKYNGGLFNSGGRNKVPFSALTVWYLPGLDHEAHVKGMSVYKDYFINNTDMYIKKMVDKLKELDEFDNKIFIIVSDHGHTEMPTDLKYKDKNWLGMEVERPAEMSCKLKLDFVDPNNPNAVTREQLAELNNNNLHIWELGEVMRAVGEANETNPENWFGILTPAEIANLNTKIDENTGKFIKLPYGATDDSNYADLVAALNGPMAHIYLTKDLSKGKVAELFRIMLKDEDFLNANKWFNLGRVKYARIRDEKINRLNFSLDQILVRVGSNYCVFDGLNADGSVKCATSDPFSSSEYVDAWIRINGLNNSNRSGDIVLIMKDATSGDAVNRYTTGSACKSWHGSLNPSDSYVPFIVAYPGGNKTEIGKILEKDTLCKTNYSKCKGNWKLTDIVKEIIFEQYK